VEEKKKHKVRVTKEDIKAGLRQLGLKKGDVVGVHSSLSSFGYVEGGAGAVVDALLEVVDEEGSIVMPTYSTNTMAVEITPEEAKMGVALKFKILPYDPKENPCSTGIISETFRKRKGAVRGLDPVTSVASMGAKAKELARGRWKRLLELDGYILLMGVGLERCSAMHLAEERVQLPPHILKRITPPKWFLEKYPEEEWEIEYGPYPDFAKMEDPCIKNGIMKTVKVGEATLKLVRLRELIDLYAEYLKKSPDLFYG